MYDTTYQSDPFGIVSVEMLAVFCANNVPINSMMIRTFAGSNKEAFTIARALVPDASLISVVRKKDKTIKVTITKDNGG